MSTVDKSIADRIIAGEFASDRVIKIVKYLNAWGEEGYGVVLHGQPRNKYDASEFIRNPEVYWESED